MEFLGKSQGNEFKFGEVWTTFSGREDGIGCIGSMYIIYMVYLPTGSKKNIPYVDPTFFCIQD